jgi:hypothetical protein
MARTEGRQTYNTFVGGLITEATGINFPENASVDEQNFVLNRNGSRQRRLGFDKENGFVHTGVIAGAAVGYVKAAAQTFFWDNTGPGNQFDVLVVQYGSLLYFFNTKKSTFGASIGSYDLTTHTTGNYTGGEFEKIACDFSSVRGALIVVGKHIDPFYIEATAVADSTVLDTFTGTSITMEIRDFDGVKSAIAAGTLYSTLTGGELEHEPATLGRSAEYNLKNQGWDQTVYDFAETYGSAATRGGALNPISDYFTGNAVYPGNHRRLFDNFKQDGQHREWDSTALVGEKNEGNAKAPNGHFVINPWTKPRDGITVDQTYVASGTLGTEVEKNRPSTVETFAGRVFYSGVESDVTVTASTMTGTPTVVKGEKNSTKIFFCRTVVSLDRLGQLYQNNDPTGETINELLPNDGGVIDIHDAGFVYKLVASHTSLFAICANGVWEITGADQAGFAATAFKVNKITNIGGIGRDSVVNAEGNVFYWSDGGIYVITRSELGDWGTQNVTEQTIQTLYTAINVINRREAVSHYDQINKQVKWLYSSDTNPVEGDHRRKYDRELIFDLNLKAFYKHHISEAGAVVGGYAPLSGQFTASDDAMVVSNGHQVISASLQDVGITQQVQGNRGALTNKYLVINQSSNPTITFGEYASTSFLDWGSIGTGIDPKAYLVAGYEIFGDPSMHKQANSLHCYFNKTEDGYTGSGGDLAAASSSSCFVRARWDWTNTGDAGKWSTKAQAYRLNKYFVPTGSSDNFANGMPVVATKNRIRGSGRALSVYFETESGKDCWLLGWTLNAEGRQMS